MEEKPLPTEKCVAKPAAPIEEPATPVGTTVEMPVDAAAPAEEPEAEAQAEPASPVAVAPADVIAAPDEDEEEDSDADDSVAPARPAPVALPATPPPAPAKAASTDGDRWAGTMTHEWNENEKQTLPDLPEVAPKPKAKARPKITVAQAVEKIPADALKYIRENFKTDVQHIRAYDPVRTAKS